MSLTCPFAIKSRAAAVMLLVLGAQAASAQRTSNVEPFPPIVFRFEVESEQYSDRWGDSVQVLRRMVESALIPVMKARYGFIRWNEKQSRDTLILRVRGNDLKRQTIQELVGAVAGRIAPKDIDAFVFGDPFESFAVTANRRNLRLQDLVDEWVRRTAEMLDSEGVTFVEQVLGKIPIDARVEIDAANAKAMMLGLPLNRFKSPGQSEPRFRANVVLVHPKDRTTGAADFTLARCLSSPRGSQCVIAAIVFAEVTYTAGEMRTLLGEFTVGNRKLYLLKYSPPLRSAGTVAIR